MFMEVNHVVDYLAHPAGLDQDLQSCVRILSAPAQFIIADAEGITFIQMQGFSFPITQQQHQRQEEEDVKKNF